MPQANEAIVRFKFAGFRVRAWITTDTVVHWGYVDTLRDRMKRFLEERESWIYPSIDGVATSCLEFPNVSAVEVTVRGQGVVIYKEWP